MACSVAVWKGHGAGALPAAMCKRRCTASASAAFCASMMLGGRLFAKKTDA